MAMAILSFSLDRECSLFRVARTIDCVVVSAVQVTLSQQRWLHVGAHPVRDRLRTRIVPQIR